MSAILTVTVLALAAILVASAPRDKVRWWTVSAAFYGLFWLSQRDNWWALAGALLSIGCALWEWRVKDDTWRNFQKRNQP